MSQAIVMAATIDRERTRIENASIRSATAAVRDLRAGLIQHVEGHIPLGPILHTFQSSMAKSIHSGMVTAHLQGRLRSAITAERFMRGRNGKALKLSTIDDAMEFLTRRLNLSPQAAAQIQAQYGQAATTAAGTLGDGVLKIAEQVAVDTVAGGLTTSGAVSAIRQALDSRGLTISNPYQISTIYRTSVQTAYSAGRWSANEDPAIQEILWGYEYSAVMDDRTTELCSSLDGMRRAAGDPVWDRLTPPNHYNCRSTVIEVFNHGVLATPTEVPDVSAAAGFGFNPGKVFADLLRAA